MAASAALRERQNRLNQPEIATPRKLRSLQALCMIPHYNMTGEIAEGLQEVIDRRREPLFSLLRQTYCEAKILRRSPVLRSNENYYQRDAPAPKIHFFSFLNEDGRPVLTRGRPIKLPILKKCSFASSFVSYCSYRHIYPVVEVEVVSRK